MGVAIAKWFSSILGIWGYKVFECAKIGKKGQKKKSYRQRHVGLGYSAPCKWIYVVFCVWGTCRCLHQPSKLHHPPLHGLACSTTFSRRKIKIKIWTITIGFLAALVLGNAYACIHVPSAPRAWPPKNLTITIGVLALLVLGNMSACIRVSSAPRAWPPNNNIVFYTQKVKVGPYLVKILGQGFFWEEKERER